MGFTEKMRELLGAEGARLELEELSGSLKPGGTATFKLRMTGGTRPARVDAVVLRLIEADRYWVSEDGTRMSEDQVEGLVDRRDLTPAWERQALARRRIELDRTIDPGEQVELDLEFALPNECRPTSTACSHTLNVQADIKGQIDPTANLRITIAYGD